jgi:hypothetical protein
LSSDLAARAAWLSPRGGQPASDDVPHRRTLIPAGGMTDNHRSHEKY